MHILQIYFTCTKLKSEGRKKRDVVFRKNSGSRKIRTPASCITAIGANHYAMPHPPYSIVGLSMSLIQLFSLQLKT